MRILVEPNAHHLQNMGDVAMLRVAVERLTELWPDARIDVITDDPALLRRQCPTAHAVPAGGRRIWFQESLLGNRLRQALPSRVAAGVRAREEDVRRSWPGGAMRALAAKRRLKRRTTTELDQFFTAVTEADLVVVSGAGALADDFAPLAITILDLLELAIRRGIPVAMLGQGVGPIADLRLRRRAEAVLPRIDLIGIREQVRSLPLLKALGVADERIHLTGDDAVELAFRAGAVPGDARALGVNVRMARYSGVTSDDLGAIADAVKAVAEDHEAELVGLPISRYEKERDASVVSTMLDTGDVAPPDDPVDVVLAARRCRVVVTGSYHAAVFALAQGIPAVGLAASEYYVGKFEGLVDLFGRGCRLVRVDGDNLSAALRREIAAVWETADDVRDELLAAAEEQVASGRRTYEALRRLSTQDFNCDRQDSPTWDERATVAAALLRDHLDERDDSTPLEIGDFGAGNERLRTALANALPRAHVYRPYDLRPQRSTTVQIDLADSLPEHTFDAVFCLGLLEYFEDPLAFLERLSRVTDVAVLSYVVSDGSEQLTMEDRRARGWLSDLTTGQVEELLAQAQLEYVARAVTNRGRTAIWLTRSRRPRSA